VPDAANPQVGVVNVGSTLYGTTESGGANNLGAVYSVTTTGAETVMHSFAAGADGENPDAPLTNVNGTLYGTTYQAGKEHGTIFTMTPSGSYNIVYNFGTKTDDCLEPDSAMIYVPSKNALYGTAYAGGAHGNGCIFKLNLSGKKPKESVVYSFTGAASSDGTNASAPAFYKNALYVVTPEGRANDYDAILKVTLSGKESVLYDFQSKVSSPDGYPCAPFGALLSLNGTLYGTTEYSTHTGDGTVYAVP
jgi:uncharacterized repeat protein (TIGR03803 family)